MKACQWGAPTVAAVLLGALTGIGGGFARDILVNGIPTVLRADLYAVAPLAGAVVVVSGTVLKLPSGLVTGAGLILCFGLRFIAIRRGWHLPTARWPEEARRPLAAPGDRVDENHKRELDEPDGKYQRRAHRAAITGWMNKSGLTMQCRN